MMERKCPNCQAKVEADESFCPECGTKIPVEEPKKNSKPGKESGNSFIGEGSRINAMGGISQTNTHQETVVAGQIDQSQTVIHNKEVKEFCEICGMPFEGKHARCPECGREICFDCKVKGKNRCKKCEEKAEEAYQASFQNVLFSSKGRLDAVARQMMDQKARELDVRDVKDSIEAEVLKNYQQTHQAVQPEVVAGSAGTSTAAKHKAGETVTTRGVGSLAGGGTVVAKDNKKGGNSLGMIVILLLVVVAAVYLLVGGEKESEQATAPSQQVEQVTDEKPASQSASSQPASQTVKQTKTAPAVVETPKPAVKKDTSYEEGMKAYEAGNGLEAINAFQKSGSAKAYYMLGVIYENGCGNVGKNAMLARKNFKKAAQLGSEEAKAKL